MSVDFDIITSIRGDRILHGNALNAVFAATAEDRKCQFYLLSLHRDRLVEACKAFNRDWKALEGAVGLINLEQRLQAQLGTFVGSSNEETSVKVEISIKWSNCHD